jgi:dienelactone hydrolase
MDSRSEPGDWFLSAPHPMVCHRTSFRIVFLVAALICTGFTNHSAAQNANTNSVTSLPVRQLPRENQLVYRDQQGALQPINSCEDYALRREATRASLDAVLGQLPGEEKHCELDVQVLEEIDKGSYLQRRITYQSEPGCCVPALLLIPRHALLPDTSKVPAVLCLHQTTSLGPDEVAGNGGSSSLHYGKELVQRGYVVLAPTYPALLSQYQPDLTALGWRSGMLKAVWDDQRGLDLLDSLPYVRPGHYAAIGHSLGGHTAIFAAFYDPRITVVVSSCGFDAYTDYYRGDPAVWNLGRGWTQNRYIPRLAEYRGRLGDIPYDYHELIAGLAPRHVFVNAPLRDGNFRADSVDNVLAAARPVFALCGATNHLQVLHPDCGHDFPPAVREEAYNLIDSVLKPANP